MNSLGALQVDGPEPKLPHQDLNQDSKGEKEEHFVDAYAVERHAAPTPSFASLLYFAKEQRASEDAQIGLPDGASDGAEINNSIVLPHETPEDLERMRAKRALRSAGVLAIFFLITTDILGPTSAPWAFSQLGFVSGTLLFTSLGAVAAYTGFLLWIMYIAVDSDRYPIRSYGDLAQICFGKYARHSVNVLQSIQLLFNVAIIILGNGQGLSQIAMGKVCFSALMIIWTVAGIAIGQIKSLKNFTYIANAAVFMNLLVIFITMGAVAHETVDYTSATIVLPGLIPSGPVAIVSQGFQVQVVAALQIVYAYGGAMLFVEFMSEMKRPFDFWKAMIMAQALIFTAYLMFGVFVYAFQGNAVINPANQGISSYAYQTATNVLSLISALIAAGLYGNIGLKVLYINVFEDIFGAPSLVSRKGRLIWTGIVPLYWSLAFVIASAVPQFSSISGIVAALCILQFTYTFPPIFHVSFAMQRDAVVSHPAFDPSVAYPVVMDTFRDRSWWTRAIRRHWYWKLANMVLFLAALVTAGLGSYSSIEGIIAGFASGAASSFGCKSPN